MLDHGAVQLVPVFVVFSRWISRTTEELYCPPCQKQETRGAEASSDWPKVIALLAFSGLGPDPMLPRPMDCPHSPPLVTTLLGNSWDLVLSVQSGAASSPENGKCQIFQTKRRGAWLACEPTGEEVSHPQLSMTLLSQGRREDGPLGSESHLRSWV